MNRMIRMFALGIYVGSFVTCQAENWPNWRGPTGQGVAESGDYPLHWDATSHVAWKLPLPGRSGSTPAIWDDRIFVTCADGEQNALLCLNRNGQLLWKKHLGTLRTGKHRKGTGCNPSPTTDGKHVVVYFKSGDLACFDFEANVLWQKNLQTLYGPDTLWWDLGTSPVLAGDLVIVACLQSGPSYLAAFDVSTGALRWKHDRRMKAPEEANQSYTTPILATEHGQPVIVVTGADTVTSHRVQDGEEIWRVRDLNPDKNAYFRSIASSVLAGEHVLVPYARGATLTAIALGGEGDVTPSHVRWVRADMASDVPTPAYAESKAYICSDRGDITCLDVASGETRWERSLPSSRITYSSSPILAGKYLFVTREDGTTFVCDVTQEGDVVSENSVNEQTVATPVLVDERIYLQTFQHLYCFANDTH